VTLYRGLEKRAKSVWLLKEWNMQWCLLHGGHHFLGTSSWIVWEEVLGWPLEAFCCLFTNEWEFLIQWGLFVRIRPLAGEEEEEQQLQRFAFSQVPVSSRAFPCLSMLVVTLSCSSEGALQQHSMFPRFASCSASLVISQSSAATFISHRRPHPEREESAWLAASVVGLG
jgi:hypothetical protein